MSKRKEQKQRSRRRPTGRVPRISSERLTRGWSGPDGTQLRLARPGDAVDIVRFMAMAGAPIEREMADAIDNDDTCAAVLEMVDGGKMALATRVHALMHASDTASHEAALITVLVAEARGGGLAGAVVAFPPLGIVDQGIASGVAPDRMLFATVSLLVKFSGLGVDEAARGRGIGGALLKGAIRLYTQLGYQLFYGQIESDKGLESYYERLGFQVLATGRSLSLETIGIPTRITTGSADERLIVYRPAASLPSRIRG